MLGHSRAVENGLPPCLMYVCVCVYVRGAHCPVRTVQYMYGTVQYCTVRVRWTADSADSPTRVAGLACARGLGVACGVDPQAV